MEQVYFLHIAKTAGTSFRTLLEEQFAPEDIAPFYLTHELAAAVQENPDCVNQYPHLRGHMGYSPVLLMKQPPRMLTLLRDPVERTISHYEHIIRHKDHWLFKDLPSPELSLDAFLDFEPARNLITNFQARNLAQDFDFSKDILNAEGNVVPANLGRLFATFLPENEDAMLKTALTRIKSFDFVCATEELNSQLPRLAKTFGWKIPKSAPIYNAAPKEKRLKQEALSQETLETIQSLTILDQTLYKHVTKHTAQNSGG